MHRNAVHGVKCRRQDYYPQRASDTGRACGPASDARIAAMAYCAENYMPLTDGNIQKAARLLQEAKGERESS